MSAGNLYVYYTTYPNGVSQKHSYQQTNIIKFEAQRAKLTLQGTAAVDGYVDGQFAFSEYDGNLRIAATADMLDGTALNNVYVLDKDLRPIGLLKGLAPGERIYSVRYIGKMAYLVTFRQVDPLFAIDLSDPRAPKLLGQLKIPGFSEYLHPIDDKTLLGIGRGANAQGVESGLKLSLFDVSDPLSPKETHVYNFGASGSYSEALYNHKAVLFNAQRQLMAFPAAISTQNNRQDAYVVFRFDKQKGFTLEKSITHTAQNPHGAFHIINRGVYIGDTLYTFSADQIASHNLDTFADKGICELK